MFDNSKYDRVILGRAKRIAHNPLPQEHYDYSDYRKIIEFLLMKIQEMEGQK